MRFSSVPAFTTIGLLFAPTFALVAQPTPAPRFESVPAQGPRTIFSDPTLRPMANPGGPANFCATLPIDFRGNGRPDLFVAYAIFPPFPPQKMPVRVFRPQPDGSITEITRQLFGNGTLPSSTAASKIVIGDFNRDGRPDIFIADEGWDAFPFPGTVNTLLLSNPDGTYTDRSSTLPQTPASAHDAAVGDVNGDGILDIYVCNVGAQLTLGSYFLIGKGDGTFTRVTSGLPATVASVQEKFSACALVDLDGDGKLDLVLGTQPERGFLDSIVLFNDGTGDFTKRPRLVLPPGPLGRGNGGVEGITALDIDRDGRPDLIMTYSPIAVYAGLGLQILMNRGNGTMVDESVARLGPNASRTTGTPFGAPRLLDLNGDGITDFYFHNGPADNVPRYFLGNRDGTFSAVAPTALPQGFGFGVTAVDFDGDGRPDLLAAGHTPEGDVQYLSFFNRPPSDAYLSNISVRTQAGTGDQTLIVGFVLGGGSDSKPLVVRAIGPSLSPFGVTGTLVDPMVEVAPLGGAKLTENNDWGGTAALKNAFASVGAFALSPDTSKDAALVFSPTPGAYTATVTGANGTTGVALVEVYDAGSGNSPRLTNVSARTQVGTGADVLITGFVVKGTLPKKLLIRASGPSLAAFGVGGTLIDPVLTVRPLGSDTIVASNDDWAGTAAIKAAFTSVGAFAFVSDTSKDAAVAVELPPGAYTATVSGKNNTTGVALVEVYELP